MPKAGFMTAKAIGNRIKSKGLQRLRWYCQMCEKQCRDANGFKCHCTSEGHLRQMAVAASNPSKVIDTFSEAFEKDFIALVSRRFGERRVHANLVYNEMIQDKVHTHMNATMWTTLTDFVKYLGRTGKCVVDETERGWFIRYKSTDPRVVRVREAAARRSKAALADEELTAKRIAQQVAEAQAAARERGETLDELSGEARELRRSSGEDGGESAVRMSFAMPSKPAGVSAAPLGGFVAAAAVSAFSALPSSASATASASAAAAATATTGSSRFGPPVGVGDGGRKKRKAPSEMERMMEEDAERKRRAAQRRAAEMGAVATAFGGSGGVGAEEAPPLPPPKKKKKKSKKKAKKARQAAGEQVGSDAPPWVCTGIVVRVVNRELGGGRFYKQKGTIIAVKDEFCATVRMTTGDAAGKKLKIDQDELETVLPAAAAGESLRVVGGTHRGEGAVLLACDRMSYRATVRLAISGAEVALDYEDVCLAAGSG